MADGKKPNIQTITAAFVTRNTDFSLIHICIILCCYFYFFVELLTLRKQKREQKAPVFHIFRKNAILLLFMPHNISPGT